MNAKDLITILGNVSPDTVVTIATDTGTRNVADVLTNGYNGGKITLIPED